MADNKQNSNKLVVRSNNQQRKITFSDKQKYDMAVLNEKENISESNNRIHDIEQKLKELKALENEMKKQNSKKSSVKSNKKEEKKRNDVPVGKKHEIVTVAKYKNYDYDYDKRRKEWHEKAGYNEEQVVCSICNDDDNWSTIKLENGNHVCYFCWIKKASNQNKLTVIKKTVKKSSNTSTKTTSTKIDYEKIYPVELDTLRTAFEVLPAKERKEYNKKIYKMIDHLIEKKFIEKRH